MSSVDYVIISVLDDPSQSPCCHVATINLLDNRCLSDGVMGNLTSPHAEGIIVTGGVSCGN